MHDAFSTPSIKGSIFALGVEGLLALEKAGMASRSDLETTLDPEVVQHLDEEILPGCWYPIAVLEKLVAAGLRRSGLAAERFLEDQGRAAADRILGFDAYAAFRREIETRGRKSATTLIAMARLIFNFGDFSLARNEIEASGEFQIVAVDVSQLPDLLVPTLRGFIACLATRILGEEARVTSARPSPDRLVFDGAPV